MLKEIRFRCWISVEGEKFFGPGRMELLGHIHSEGSLSRAARKMGMSYKKAWDMVNDLNSRGSKPFVLLKKGGEKGGELKSRNTHKTSSRVSKNYPRK